METELVVKTNLKFYIFWLLNIFYNHQIITQPLYIDSPLIDDQFACVDDAS